MMNTVLPVLLLILMAAFLIEAVWEALKPAWPAKLKAWEEQKGLPLDFWGVLLLSVGVSVAAELDIFGALGVNLGVPVLGAILTGILISRGSNFVHEKIKGAQAYRENNSLFNALTVTELEATKAMEAETGQGKGE